MTNDYSSDAQAVADAMNAVYENKQTNKKNDISGDYSSDNASYPTVKAVKSEFGAKVTSWSSTTADTNYPSEKLVKDSLDNKISKSQTTGLVKNDGTIDTTTKEVTSNKVTSWSGTVTDTNYPSEKLVKDTIDTKTITVEKQSTAETGYASTYVIKQNGSQVGVKINIEKDRMLRSASYETVGAIPTPEEEAAGLHTGDKYIKLVVNTTDGGGTPSILILPIDDIFDMQTADETTLTLSAQGVFSIKSAGVDTTQLKDGAVTADKIASAVKNSWLTTSDVQSEISDFAAALAEAINPSSP